jgi:hypothetical protein
MSLCIPPPPPCGASTQVRVMEHPYVPLRLHSDTPHSVALPWASDQPDAETSTWQHTTLTRDRTSWPRWDSNPQSLQVSVTDLRLRLRGRWIDVPRHYKENLLFILRTIWNTQCAQSVLCLAPNCCSTHSLGLSASLKFTAIKLRDCTVCGG